MFMSAKKHHGRWKSYHLPGSRRLRNKNIVVGIRNFINVKKYHDAEVRE